MGMNEAHAEVERRYPETAPYYANRRLVSPEVEELRVAFEEGAEWAHERLLAAAAALPGGTE